MKKLVAFRSRAVLPLLVCLVIFTSVPLVAKQYSGLPPETRAKALWRHFYQHVGDITVVKLYDQYKWLNKISEVKSYAREHEPSPVRKVEGFEKTGGNVVFRVKTADGSQGFLAISFPFQDAVRVRAGLGAILDMKPSQHEAKVSEEQDGFLVSSGKVTVRISKDPFRIRFSEQGGGGLGGPRENSLKSGLSLGNDLCRQSFALTDDEVIIGGGEQYGWWNHNGHIVINDTDDAYQTTSGNTYIPVPVFLSSRGYGLFLDTYQKARFDFGKSEPGVFFFENPGSELDYYLFFQNDPSRIIEEQSALVGRSHMVPKWTLEPWISRRTWLGWRYDKGAVRDINTMISEGFPLGVIMYENMTMENQAGIDMQVHKKNKPNMPDIIEDWHERGIKVVGYHRCGQFEKDKKNLDYYSFLDHPDYLVRNPDGSFYTGGVTGNKVYLDITNPDALEYAWQNVFKRLFVPGPDNEATFSHLNLDGVKVDFGEFFPGDQVPLQMHDRRPGMRLYYPSFFSEWLYKKINSVKPEGGITWVRGAGLGARRTGIVWAGDRGRTFRQLRTTVMSGLHAAASGLSLWGTDLGGYTGGGINAEEVYNRAVAFSCFSASFHDHGSALAPWNQTEEGKDIYRFYARLRYNLIPYLYHLFWQAHDRGLPVIRPMAFECPEKKQCWMMDEQYMLGEDLLVAPVLSLTRKKEVYLPEGQWMDFWTRETRTGPARIKYETPKDTIPVFVRMNSAVPVQWNKELVPGGEFPQSEKDDLIPGFLVYAGAPAVIEGEWKTRDPRLSQDVKTNLSMRISKEKIKIEEASGAASAVLAYNAKPKEVWFKGEKVNRRQGRPGEESHWYFRESDGAAVIYLSGD
ncbi:MAG: glycoside hydrolase family 31 protein [bacterium]